MRSDLRRSIYLEENEMISEYLLGGALIFMSVVLMILVLMQSGKDNKLSGTITGGSSDTYYG